jgi:hypothetical protein
MLSSPGRNLERDTQFVESVQWNMDTRLSAHLEGSIETHAHYVSVLNGLLPEDLQVRRAHMTPRQTPKSPAGGHLSTVVGRFASLELEGQEATDTGSDFTEQTGFSFRTRKGRPPRREFSR